MIGQVRGAALLAMALTSAVATAQIAHGGLAFGLMQQGPELPEAPVVNLPDVDAERLLQEDAERMALGKAAPYRYGANHDVEIGMDAGVWTELQNGDRIWRLTLHCPGAFGVGMVFSRYVVPHGALVFLYNEAREQRGAFMAATGGRTSMAVDLLAGDRVTIEYFEPATVRGLGELAVGRVTHAYRDVLKAARDFGDSGECNINVICPEGDLWRDQIRAVALIDVGGGYCTGTLINNCAQDGTPYFLTANHCLGSPVENWIFRFNWDSPTCTPTANAPMDQTISGAELLASSAGTDMALLLLNDTPPAEYEVFYSGWDNSFTPAQEVTGIHHPLGDIKKISHSFQPVVEGVMIGAQSWNVLEWDEGTTEPGSSGSGLWNEWGLLVGQLVGGAANCANSVDDYYGRFDLTYPLVQEWLGNCGSVLEGLDSEEAEPITVDAAVTSITNVPALVCGSNMITPRVTLKNNGIGVITSLIINYGIQGEVPSMTVWNGSLLPGQTVNFFLPTLIVPAGDLVLEVTCNSPNGEQDQVPLNDSWTLAFTVNSPSEVMHLLLTPDLYGIDITWTLTSENGTTLYSGGPYIIGAAPVTVPFCLTNGCYTFTINDVFGDGICCSNGEGNYVIQTADSVVFASSDGQYGSQNVDVFCLEGVQVAEVAGMPVELVVFPNPTNGLLDLRCGLPMQRIALLDGTGRLLSSLGIGAMARTATLDLSTLANGIYLLEVWTSAGRTVERVLVQR
jgi:lysyl endopeptidase